MDTDDLEPIIPLPQKLDVERMSVEALEDYIASLEKEIVRARAAIAAKGNARATAETFFKSR